MRTSVTVLLSLLLLIGWYVFLRPTMLGGPTTYLIISGMSMEPTFYNGDLVLVSRQNEYRVGDVIAYGVDDHFLTEKYVIHRIVGETPNGEFLTQGDNRDDIDPWTPTHDRVVGSAFAKVPQLGVAIAYLQEDPRRLAVAAGAATLLSVVPIGIRHTPQDRRHRRRQRLAQRKKDRVTW